jgi:long-chain acyl-CoA synthetase
VFGSGLYDGGVRAHLASLVEVYRQHSAETAVVVHRGNRRYRTTYGELAQFAGRFAAELERRGVSAGERVVLWGENSAAWMSVFFGCLMRGVIAVPLDAAGSSEFVERVVKDVAPKLIVGDRNLLNTIQTDVPRLLFSELATQLPAEPIFDVSETVNAQTPFQIVFTSGTTSAPKGIVHTHRNVLASLQPIENEIAKYRRYERWVHPLRFLHTLPLSHVFGQFMGLWVPPLLAAEIHFVDQFEARRITGILRRERISVLVAVPRVLQLLRAHLLERFDSLEQELEPAKRLSIWKRWWRFRQVHRALGWKFWAVISGGATLPAELEGFWSRLGFALIQGYGMTETAALVTLNHPFKIGQGTIGKALPGREVRISGDGEILVRGDMLSAATWQGGQMRPREDEWLATGDLAAENESGELRFLGRKGDVIVTGAGMNVHPVDLEEAMSRQPGVRGCVVVPYKTIGGAEPVAAVIFSGDDEALQAAVRRANGELAGYQQIRRVLKWPELQFPFTSTGKLLRRKVERWVGETLTNQQWESQSTSPEQDMLANLIEEVTGEPVSSSDDQRLSEDLHLDSLGRVQLQSALEQRLGLELEDDAVATAETLGELRALLTKESGVNLPHSMTPEPKPEVTQIESGATQKREASGHVYPRWPWSWPIKVVRMGFIELVMRPLIAILAAPRVVRDTDELPQGPLLIVANHVTAYDGALVVHALPGRLRRRIAIAMSGETLSDLKQGRNQQRALYNLLAPAGYWLVTALFNVFPLPRLRGFRRSFEHAGEAMDQGYSVLIFPEGTRSRDGKLHPFRPGIGLLSQQSRVPIVPVALIGLDEMRKTRWFRSGHLEIHVGAAIPVDESLTPAELTARLEESVRQLTLSAHHLY